MKKLICLAFMCLIFSLSTSAQSGIGGLKGYVADGFKNASTIEATVELRSIENHAGTTVMETFQTKGGHYDFQVSFGYYLLTISADGYQTYRTKVYIPSSSFLKWATILEKNAQSTSRIMTPIKSRKGKKI